MKLFTIPNIITLGNLLCGIMGLIYLQNGSIEIAAYLILIALILDFLDGFVARITNSYSDIGKQLDSLADMVSFGVLPSMILFYLLKDADYWRYITLLPAMASALRLAKFNIDNRQTDSFRGLPTPANAMVIAAFPFILHDGGPYLNPQNTFFIICIYSILISLIMISDLPMLALKFKSYAWEINKVRYIFLISSVTLLIVFQFTGVPLILLLYVLFSLIQKWLPS
jgi:CDP-diacylglycerol--serine O-phosphatidyltransferase